MKLLLLEMCVARISGPESVDLAYRSEKLGETLARAGFTLLTESSRQHGATQQAEVAFTTQKRVFETSRTLTKTLVRLASRIVAKVTAYT